MVCLGIKSPKGLFTYSLPPLSPFQHPQLTAATNLDDVHNMHPISYQSDPPKPNQVPHKGTLPISPSPNIPQPPQPPQLSKWPC